MKKSIAIFFAIIFIAFIVVLFGLIKKDDNIIELTELNIDEQIQTSIVETDSQTNNEIIETTVDETAGDETTVELDKYEKDSKGRYIITEENFVVSVKDRPASVFYVQNYDMDINLPTGHIIGLAFENEIQADAVLVLDGDYNGNQVRNFINLDQTNSAITSDGNDSQKTGNPFIKEFKLSGEIYSCTALLSGCEQLVTADLSECYNESGFYQFQLLFEGCSSLNEISLPNNILEISMGMFAGCKKLGNIILPDSIETIDAFAFYGCNSLDELVLSDKVRFIGKNAFEGCENLTIIANENSYAYKYALENNLRVKEHNE